MNLNEDMDVKPDVEMKSIHICRCCLSTEWRMMRIDKLRYLFMDLADIIVSDSDGLPQDICWECAALLRKSVRFKQKVLNSHTVLYDYHNRCAPFAIDGQDPELTKYSTPHLSETSVVVFDNFDSAKTKVGFHTALQHEKHFKDVTLENINTFPNPIENNIDVKQEDFQIEYDDHSVLAEDYDRINDTDSQDYKEERKSQERKKRVKIKSLNKKEECSDADAKTKTRKTKTAKLDIDETKIRIVRLDPLEQLKQREEECKSTLNFPFICHLCYKGFIFEEKLKNHMKKHSPSRGSYKCETCSMYLPTNYSLSVHTLIHTRRFECLSCGRRMIDKDAIINHYRSEHEGITSVFTCHICGKIFNNHKTMRGHIRNQHTLSRVKCDECGKTLVNTDALAEHKLIHEGVKNHECPICSKRFRTRQQVRYHQNKHSDVKNYYCVECDTRFKTSHALSQHLKKSVKHKDIHSLIHGCSRCGKRFETAAALAHHRAVQHEGERRHACPSCPAALATRSSLLKHVRVLHGGVRAPAKHVCDTCGKVFKAKSTLTNHLRTHTGEKPFACAECGRRFAQRSAMRTHVKLVHLKLHRNSKIKPKQPNDLLKFKEESPLVFDWPRQAVPGCEFFTVTAGP